MRTLKEAKAIYCGEMLQLPRRHRQRRRLRRHDVRPGPADLTDAKRMNKFTDGELYYKITVGKKPMPSFEKRLQRRAALGPRQSGALLRRRCTSSAITDLSVSHFYFDRCILFPREIQFSILFREFSCAFFRVFLLFCLLLVPAVFAAPGAVRCGKLLDVRSGQIFSRPSRDLR